MRRAFGLMVLATMFGACAPAEPEVGVSSAAIISGEDSPSGAEDAVVLLVHATRSEVGACSATLVAPNLLLTALHCVAEMKDEGSVCDDKGKALYGGRIGKLHDATDMYVFVGNERPSFRGGRSEPDGRGARIFAPETDVICNSDIALIELEAPITSMPIAALRLDAPVVADETITSVGWGVTTRTPSPQTRQRRTEVPVIAVGPTAKRGLEAAEGEFVVGESICQGDSGGPAFSTDTGAILGVVSRGGNGQQGSSPSAGCTGQNAVNLYTGVAAHRDMILAAFEEVGAAPWLEGELNPILGKFGEACENGEQCQQGVCVETKKGAGTTCNLDCADDACPSGYTCATQGGDKVCVAKDDEDEGGCAVGGRGAAAAWWLALGALILLRRSRAVG